MTYRVIHLRGYSALLLGVFLAGCFFAPGRRRATEGKIVYENNFEKAQPGKLPDDFLVLDGAFSIKEQDGNKFVELPGAPLDSFGVLFGPTESGGSAVSA